MVIVVEPIIEIKDKHLHVCFEDIMLVTGGDPVVLKIYHAPPYRIDTSSKIALVLHAEDLVLNASVFRTNSYPSTIAAQRTENAMSLAKSSRMFSNSCMVFLLGACAINAVTAHAAARLSGTDTHN